MIVMTTMTPKGEEVRTYEFTESGLVMVSIYSILRPCNGRFINSGLVMVSSSTQALSW